MNRGLTYLAAGVCVCAVGHLRSYASVAGLADYRKDVEAAVHGGYKRLMVRPVTTLYEYYNGKIPLKPCSYADIMCEIARHRGRYAGCRGAGIIWKHFAGPGIESASLFITPCRNRHRYRPVGEQQQETAHHLPWCR